MVRLPILLDEEEDDDIIQAQPSLKAKFKPRKIKLKSSIESKDGASTARASINDEMPEREKEKNESDGGDVLENLALPQRRFKKLNKINSGLS